VLRCFFACYCRHCPDVCWFAPFHTHLPLSFAVACNLSPSYPFSRILFFASTLVFSLLLSFWVLERFSTWFNGFHHTRHFTEHQDPCYPTSHYHYHLSYILSRRSLTRTYALKFILCTLYQHLHPTRHVFYLLYRSTYFFASTQQDNPHPPPP